MKFLTIKGQIKNVFIRAAALHASQHLLYHLQKTIHVECVVLAKSESNRTRRYSGY